MKDCVAFHDFPKDPSLHGVKGLYEVHERDVSNCLSNICSHVPCKVFWLISQIVVNSIFYSVNNHSTENFAGNKRFSNSSLIFAVR